jgi:phage shock protein A
MGIIDRLGTLARANINDLLDRAEDPEKMLNQILRDMESNIQEARGQVAQMIAQQKEMEVDLSQATRLSGEWGEKARRAVTAGKDDLGREALRRKRDQDDLVKIYQQQVDTQRQTVDTLKQQLSALESKYQSTLSQRDVLIARQRRASAQRQVSASLSSFSPMDPTADLERMERKIRSNEAEAAAMAEMEATSLDAQFKELDSDLEIEDQLASLKSELGMGAAPAALSEGSAPAPSQG